MPASEAGEGRLETSGVNTSAVRASLRFLGVATALAVILLLVARTERFDRWVQDRSLNWNAELAARVLRGMGEEAEAVGNRLRSTRFGMIVWEGCDAVEPMILFTAAVLATPVPSLARAAGLLWGIAVLGVMNQIRLLTLFWTGVHAPRAFETVHLDVWQALFIGLGIGAWLLWAYWAERFSRRRRAVA